MDTMRSNSLVENETLWWMLVDIHCQLIIAYLSELTLLIYYHLLTPNRSPACRNEVRYAVIVPGKLSARQCHRCHVKKSSVPRVSCIAVHLAFSNGNNAKPVGDTIVRKDSFTLKQQ